MTGEHTTQFRPQLVDNTPGRPVYRQIVETLADDIRSGRLLDGDRLPTHRALARQLGVAVPTISRAYREAESRGLLTSTVGRGTFVTGIPTLRSGGTPSSAEPVNLAVNGPARGEHEAALRSALADAATAPRTESFLGYESDIGAAADRLAALDWLGHTGIDATEDSVAICHGGQHAILVALGAVLKPGDVLITEALTYPGVKSAAEILGIRVLGVRMDDDGIVPEALEAACATQHKPRALYCIPTAHNPTTITLSAARRDAVVAIARRHDLHIIEDDVFGMVEPSEHRIPTLASLAPERTLHVTSLSKSLAPGLRWGALVAPPHLIDRIGGLVRATVFNPAPVAVDIARRWLLDGTAARLVSWQRTEMSERFAITHRIMSESAAVQRIRTAGLHAWITLNAPWTAPEAIALAHGLGIEIGPTSYFRAEPDVSALEDVRSIRICIGNAPGRKTLSDALSALAHALDTAPTIASTTRV